MVKGVLTMDEKTKGVMVVSNGNVKCFEDCVKNRDETGADGVMVGEALLGNPRFVSFSYRI